MARLKEKYLNEVVPGLQEQFKYTNVMAIPKLDKVVINIGLGEAVQNPKALDAFYHIQFQGKLTVLSDPGCSFLYHQKTLEKRL